MMASYLKCQWNPGVRIIIYFVAVFAVNWRINHYKSFNLDSFIDLFPVCCGSAGEVVG